MLKSLNTLGCLTGLLFSLHPILAQTSPVIGKDTHLYLRCNTTSWDVNDQSRLKPGTPGFLRELSFEVKEQWMVEAGDDCVITETPALNAWGAWQHEYGGQLSFLKVPESSRLRQSTGAEDSVYFKLRFPSVGRYRFSLNTRDSYFSVRKEDPLKAGDVSWTLPGNMVSDSFGNLFLSSYYPQNTLSSVNINTGLPVWTYADPNYISFYSQCSTKDTAFITLPGRAAALAVATGREIWSTDLNGSLKDAYAYLTCYPNSNQVFLSYGSDQTTLVSLNKTDGRAVWSWKAPAYAGIMGVDGNRVYVSTYQNSAAALKALDKSTGRELWQVEPGSGYFTIAEDSSLYFINGSNISAIASDSGRTRWSYKGQEGDSVWVSFESGKLFLHEKTRISSLDKASGRVLWSYDYSAFADQYPYAQVLKAGVVLIRVNDYNTNISKQIALNGTTGQQLWESNDFTTTGYLTEDNQSGTWLISGKTISLIEPWSGNKVWTYTLKSDQAMENIMNVMETDGSVVYLAYGVVGSKYPPMGVLALDANSGSLKWQNWLETSLYRVAGNSQQLILNTGYYGSTKALKK